MHSRPIFVLVKDQPVCGNRSWGLGLIHFGLATNTVVPDKTLCEMIMLKCNKHPCSFVQQLIRNSAKRYWSPLFWWFCTKLFFDNRDACCNWRVFSVLYSCCCFTGLGLGLNLLDLFASLAATRISALEILLLTYLLTYLLTGLVRITCRVSWSVSSLRQHAHVPGGPETSDVTVGVSEGVPGRAQLSGGGLEQAGVWRQYGRLAAMLLRLPGVDSLRCSACQCLLLWPLSQNLLFVDSRATSWWK